jgi:hypothetical protein
MANEIKARGYVRFTKGTDGDAFDLGEFVATMAGTKSLRARQTVSTSEEALGLGEVASASALVMFKNHDATNKLLIKAAAGAAVLVEVPPGETAGPFRFASTATAPFVQASASTVDFSYFLVAA